MSSVLRTASPRHHRSSSNSSSRQLQTSIHDSDEETAASSVVPRSGATHTNTHTHTHSMGNVCAFDAKRDVLDTNAASRVRRRRTSASSVSSADGSPAASRRSSRRLVDADFFGRLDPKEIRGLADLRTRIGTDFPAWKTHVKTDFRDGFCRCLRFLRGSVIPESEKRPGDRDAILRKAAEQMDAALRFERDLDVRSIADEEPPRLQAFKRLWNSGVSGFDGKGRPVVVVHPFESGLMDWDKDLVRELHARDNEIVDRIRSEMCQATGRLEPLQHIMICDFHGGKIMDRARMKWWQAANRFEDVDCDQIFQQDTLYRAYVLNATWSMRVLWNIAKVFLHPLTVRKFRVYGDASEATVRDIVSDGVPLSALPAYLHPKATGANPRGYEAKVRTVRVVAGKGSRRKDSTKSSEDDDFVVVERARVRANESVRWSVMLKGRDASGDAADVQVRAASSASHDSDDVSRVLFRSERAVTASAPIVGYARFPSWNGVVSLRLRGRGDAVVSLCVASRSGRVRHAESVHGATRSETEEKGEGAVVVSVAGPKKVRSIPAMALSSYDLL